MCSGTRNTVASPSSPSFGGIPKSYFVPPQVASEEKGKSKTGLGGMELSQFEMPSGLPPGVSPPRLGGRTRRDKFGACVSKGQTKSDQGRKALVESLSTLPSRAIRDASDRKKP